MTDDEFREQATESSREFSRRAAGRRRCSPSCFDDVRYVAGAFDERRRLRQARRRRCDEFDEDAGLPLNRCFYLSTAPTFFPVIVDALGAHGLDHARGRRRARRSSRSRSARTSRRRASSTRACSSVFDERPGLPHRPLPRQGDRPERPGVPLRQRHVRAAVEPQLHRPRADHGGRGHRRSARARATTTTPARCATSSRTTCSSCCRCCAWSRRSSFAADEVRDEKVKVLRAIKRRGPRTSRDMAVRAQYTRGHRRRRGGAGLPRGGGRARRTRTTETYAALRLEVDNWRWAGVPIYLRTGKRLARKVTEIAVTLKPVPHLGFVAGRLARRAAQHARPDASSPTRACRCSSARRSPARGCASAR